MLGENLVFLLITVTSLAAVSRRPAAVNRNIIGVLKVNFCVVFTQFLGQDTTLSYQVLRTKIFQ